METQSRGTTRGGIGAFDADRRPLWVEEPVGRPRLPDPVRESAVRAGLIVSVTLIEAVVAALAAMAEVWLAAPALLCTVVSTVVATWAVVDVWVTRQVWNQRHGVVSSPSSTARAQRRERRAARRAQRPARQAESRPGRVRGPVVAQRAQHGTR